MDFKKYVKTFIENRKKKTLLFEELEKELILELGYSDFIEQGVYDKLVFILNELVEENEIEPYKNSGKTSSYNGTFKKFKILKKTLALTEKEELEIRVHFHPKMQMGSYLTKPEQYIKDVFFLKKINNFLFKKERQDIEEVSLNQRSYEIFNDEKFLNSEEGRNLLKRVDLSIEEFKSYKTYEPFFYFQKDFSMKIKNALILENKDTFFSLKKIMRENKDSKLNFDGIEIDTLIYGEGYKIHRSIYFIEELNTSKEVRFYYFGDIDFEGFLIPAILIENNPLYSISPLESLYKQSLLKAKTLQLELGEIKNKQRKKDLSENAFLKKINSKTLSEIRAILEENHYLPEENLTEIDLKKWFLR